MNIERGNTSAIFESIVVAAHVGVCVALTSRVVVSSFATADGPLLVLRVFDVFVVAVPGEDHLPTFSFDWDTTDHTLLNKLTRLDVDQSKSTITNGERFSITA